MSENFAELDPPERLLMGPGPINVEPRVLGALAKPVVGQFDPWFTGTMNETMALLRLLFQTENRWSFAVDGTARAGIEAMLVSAIAPGDRVLVPVFGRFGHLLAEIALRAGAELRAIETEWGTVFPPGRIEDEIERFKPRLVAVVHGDTSTTMAQPLDGLGAACRRHGALLYVDATATLGGMDVAPDRWQLDAVSAGLQKCLGGPPGAAPVTFNDRFAEAVLARKHVERGIAPAGYTPGKGPVIRSNYFDLAMLMDYWGPQRLNHHTEAASMLYATRECARLALEEGLAPRFARHRAAGQAMAAGLEALGLALFGDRRHKMANIAGAAIPRGIDGERVLRTMLEKHNIEIGTSFGPLRGKIWRIGTMGLNARMEAVRPTLEALAATLGEQGLACDAGGAVAAAEAAFRREEGKAREAAQ